MAIRTGSLDIKPPSGLHRDRHPQSKVWPRCTRVASTELGCGCRCTSRCRANARAGKIEPTRSPEYRIRWPVSCISQKAMPDAMDSTQYRLLGKTGERVSPIGLGGWHLGLPTVTEKLSLRIVRSAIDRGLTFMDNS